MRDDEIDDTQDLPLDDSIELLDQLEAGFEDYDPSSERTPTGPPLSRQEIDAAVDRALAEELARLSGQGPKTKP